MVVLQIIGAVSGLAPLLAVVELGRTLLSSGPVDHGHVWTVVIRGRQSGSGKSTLIQLLPRFFDRPREAIGRFSLLRPAWRRRSNEA